MNGKRLVAGFLLVFGFVVLIAAPPSSGSIRCPTFPVVGVVQARIMTATPLWRVAPVVLITWLLVGVTVSCAGS